ncbi:MAG: protein translocase subunit SecF [Acidimicrobiales bacterium]
MSKFADILDSSADLDFRPVWKRSLPISAAIAGISIILLVFLGLNASIDFKGGGIFEVPVAAGTATEDVRGAISIADAQVQISEAAGGKTYATVSVTTEELNEAGSIVTDLSNFAGVPTDEVTSSTIGPSWGDQVTKKAFEALFFFFIAVAIYLAWTLEPLMAVGALIAVVHDIAITAGIYSLFRFEVSPATVIALLTILGYSLYDTVVVYDKVLENVGSNTSKTKSYSDIVNDAMNLVLVRSINTTVTTVLPVASMLIVGSLLLGGATLRDFSLALFIGLFLGTYSSVFVAAPALVHLHRWQDKRTGGDSTVAKKKTKHRDSLKEQARLVK